MNTQHEALLNNAIDIKQLESYARDLLNEADHKRQALLKAMTELDLTKLTGNGVEISIRKTPGTLSLPTDLKKLPEEYVKLDLIPLKDKIKAALKAGESIQGVVFNQGTHVVITAKVEV